MKYQTFFITIVMGCIFSACNPNPQATTEADLKLAGQTKGVQSTESAKLSKIIESQNTSPTSNPAPTASEEVLPKTMTIHTTKGIIKVDLYQVAAPKTISNYLKKAESHFYDNLTFHRVEDWVVQGGDPEGTGSGGGTISTELSSIPFSEGSVGVARGQNINLSNDAQFFICIKDCNWLTGQYTIFGKVSSGLNVAKNIEIGDTINSVSLQ